LPDQVDHLMADLSGLAVVAKTPGQRAGQTEALIDRLEQQGAAIAGGVGLIEGDVDGFGNEGWKENSLFCRMSHAKAFLVGVVVCGKTTLADGEAFVIQDS